MRAPTAGCLPGCDGPDPAEPDHRCSVRIADVARVPGPLSQPRRLTVELDRDSDSDRRVVVLTAVDELGRYCGDSIELDPHDVPALAAAIELAGRVAR